MLIVAAAEIKHPATGPQHVTSAFVSEHVARHHQTVSGGPYGSESIESEATQFEGRPASDLFRPVDPVPGVEQEPT